MADALEKAYDLAWAEIEKISRKEELTKEALCVLNDVIDIVKDIETIWAMKESGSYYEDGYSGRMSSSRMNRYSDGSSYSRGENGGRSGRRYSRYNSYDDGKDYMMEHLEMAMEKASSDSDRNMIRQLMDKMNNQ